MNQPSDQNLMGDQFSTQHQSLGDVQMQGDDNIFNALQAHIINLTQTKIIQISVDEIKTRKLNTTSPYKGLKKFEPADKDRFFGRDQFLVELVNELKQTNLILLLGASGSGKSSVVRAGLVPLLSEELGKSFLSLIFTPDQDPFESFYGSLLSRGFSQSQAQLARAGNVDTLSQVVRTLKQPEEFWLIVIDQFEELFTISAPEKRDRFLEGLAKLSTGRATDPQLKIVATMRADFLDRLDPAPANLVAKATQGHRPLITQMQPDELRSAIEQPAAHHGVVFETGLVKDIIKDVQGQAGYLPLLQYTLDLLWETEVQNAGIRDRTLNISSYRRLGGVRGALQQRVDEIYQGLSEPEQLATQHIFLKLVEIGGDIESGTEWRPVRRRAKRLEFSSDQEQQVLIRLIDANLLVSDAAFESIEQPQSTNAATVEIAHEALLSSWKTLQGWIDESKEVIIINNRLRDDASRWRELLSANPTAAVDELWSGTKLERVLELQKQRLFEITLGGLTEEERAFVQNSVERQQHVRQEAEAAKQRELKMTQEALKQEKRATAAAQKAEAEERRARKATQRVAGVGAALLLAVVGGVGGIWWQWQQRQFNQLLADVAIGVPNPRLLPIAERILKQGDQSFQSEQIEDALSRYKLVRDFALNLQEAAKNDSKIEFDSEDTENLRVNAENRIVALVRKERLPDLKRQLKDGEIGLGNPPYDFKQLEDQYEPGALKTTYIMVMRDTGADIDDNGEINGPEEANRIPCEVLEDIENAWRELTDNQCGWFGPKDDNPDNLNPLAPNCQQLKNQFSLVSLVFQYQPAIAINRMRYCELGEV